jgi:hypothetical protein
VRGLRDDRSGWRDGRPHLAAEQPRHVAHTAPDESRDDWRDERSAGSLYCWAERIDTGSAHVGTSRDSRQERARRDARALNALPAQYVAKSGAS